LPSPGARLRVCTNRYDVYTSICTFIQVIAILIAAIGLYAIMSFTVGSRRREFGVRLALGASRTSLLGLVLGQGLRLAAFGVAIGVFGAMGTLRVMQSQLYGVAPNDPFTLAAVAMSIVVLAILAGMAPLRRALSVDPASALRSD
jgi:ABC-type antimicrobial peptide transport system permease subunit